VTEELQRGRISRLSRAATGERLGGFIYGTILVLAVLVAGAKAYPESAGRIAALVALTTGVFWLAHVYAHALAHSVAEGESLTQVDLRCIARREASIIEAAVPPVTALLLGAFGVLSTSLSVWVAIGLGLVVLAAQGINVARIENLTWLPTIGVVTANLGLGILIIGLKLLLGH
jgi:hypothetical protein